MNLNMRWRVLIVLASIVIALVALWPTYRYSRLTADQSAAMDPTALDQLKNESLRLGLDLQGGMHVVLEIDDSKVVEDVDTGELMKRALEVIRNRIDEFGVTEPVVQQAGDRRIIVELAGIDDIERTQEIISKAAVLEFKMVRSGGEMRRLVDQLDRELARLEGVSPTSASADTTAADSAGAAVVDSAVDSVETPGVTATGEVSGGGELKSYLAEDVRKSGGRPLSPRIVYLPRQGRVAVNEEAAVRDSDVPFVTEYLDYLAEHTRAIPTDVEFAWHSDTYTDGTGNRYRNLYLLTAESELTGEVLEDARAQPDNSSNVGGNFLVQFDLNRTGRRLFSRTTGENVGRLMAIVLDGRVKSAPEIQDKIRAGTASITGSFTPEEANDLAIVLRAGALPVPISIEEQRAIGPSLGQDSIRLGTRAILFGMVAVLVFMVIYYRVAGFIAVFALLLNLLLLSAVLVYLNAVLTLPGIAGIVLTVGMAVDANVLIFERIREELRLGQSFRNALSRGYDRAFRTIFDANVTTLITALALLWFGTGPIKGFAVTLSVGIVVSMFTALFVTRVVFDLITGPGHARRVSI
jgi:protein-export membrane protein SecD